MACFLHGSIADRRFTRCSERSLAKGHAGMEAEQIALVNEQGWITKFVRDVTY